MDGENGGDAGQEPGGPVAGAGREPGGPVAGARQEPFARAQDAPGAPKHREIEAKWQRVWEKDGLYRCDLDGARRPFFNLVEFPYPSGEGLHVGHFYSYGGADTYGRYQRMRGHDVFQPMGFDAFGIHPENYALKLGENPSVVVPRNVRRFREEQLERMGAAFDWSRAVDTTDPRYYRWTQWAFLQLYRGGLAYRAEAPVNWCPLCLTTLADEQVIDGHCERCQAPVARRPLTQWFFCITRYADRLLDMSHGDYPETTRRLQAHWIGRREGAEIDFCIDVGAPLTVFTTRPDTLYGATFLVLAPEHPRVAELTAPERSGVVRSYIEAASRRSELERQTESHAKTGVWTGRHAVNPVNGRRLPIWVADYVLVGFGTGAIFATPAHDARDLEFARTHGLDVLPVVRPPGVASHGPSAWPSDRDAYEGDGTLIHSGPFDGLGVDEAKRAIVAHLAARGQGRSAVTYRLRDWLISRQRYWGPPIPIVYCAVCGELPVPEADLPVRLPETEHYRPLGTGESPLAAIPSFVQAICPRCGGPARRETDVSDNFLDSSWYFLRYTSTECDDRPWDNGRLRRWLPVAQYTGGIEHSTMHHLYSRFLWKAMQDLGHIPRELGPEPFARLRLHGLIIKDGRRMSKSRGNVVVPDDYVARYGADALRVYLLFMGPFEEGGDFQDHGINGVVRFLNRVWRLGVPSDGVVSAKRDPAATRQLLRLSHQAIRKVTQDIEAMAFNTAIAALMSHANALQACCETASVAEWDEAVRMLLLLLAPFAPHLVEEIWALRGGPYSVHQQPWPPWDEALAAEETVTLVVQVNGRLRGRLTVPAGLSAGRARALAEADGRVADHLRGAVIRRVIHVPDRLVNFVLEAKR